MTRRPPTIATTAILLLAAASARAQTSGDDVRDDIRQARSDAAIATSQLSVVSSHTFVKGEVLPASWGVFTVTGLAPLLYNSNAETIPSGGTSTFEVTPEARVAWSRTFSDQLKVLGLGDASADRYQHSNGADSEVLLAKVRIQYVGRGAEGFQPFVGYQPKRTFAPTSDPQTAQDLAAGVDKTVLFAPLWSFGVTGTLTRRFKNTVSSFYILTAAPSLTYSGTWSASLSAPILRRWIDKTDGTSRQDWVATPVLTIEWDLGRWFPALNALVLDVQLSYSNVSSTDASVEFHQWTLGPIVNATWSFPRQ